MNRKYFEKHHIDPTLLETVNWAMVDELNLSEKNREIFKKRKSAIDDFIYSDKPLNQIHKEHGIHKVQLYRMINSCLEVDSSGIILGYRSLIPYKMKKSTYTRNSLPKFTTNSNGAFQLLLLKHPELKEFIITKYRNKRNQSVTDSKIKIKFLHKQFLEQCRLLGISENEYPFNTDSAGIRSLQRYVKKLENEHFLIAASRSGSEALQHAKSTGTGKQNIPMVIKPFQRVQFDGHKIDECIAIEFTTPEGDVIVEVMNRIWLLVIIDGFPDWKHEECKWGLWDEFSFDNAKANLANIVIDR